MIKHTKQEGDYMRQPTTLERIETACYDTMATSDDAYEVRDAMTALGMTHLAMEPGKLPLAMRELWAGMHGRTGLETSALLRRLLATLPAGTAIHAPKNTPMHCARIDANRATLKSPRADARLTTRQAIYFLLRQFALPSV